jgi:hypothetical protein
LTSITDLKFLTPAEQDAAFNAIDSGLSDLLIRGRLTRIGHRSILQMVNTLNDLWLNHQANDDGTPRKENRWPMPKDSNASQ